MSWMQNYPTLHVDKKCARTPPIFHRGSKYQNMKRKSDANNFTKWEPFIVPSKNRAGYLFCALTCRVSLVDATQTPLHLYLIFFVFRLNLHRVCCPLY